MLMNCLAALSKPAPARVLACGAYLKNTACLIEDQRVLWSPPHGDLTDAASREALEASVATLLAQASGPLQAVAHDLHPDFPSTHLAQQVAAGLGVPTVPVQHHHAHVAVVHAEQPVEGSVIGVALDGVGLGDDGAAWGGEVLWVDGYPNAHQWRRLDHLAPLALPGGDMAAREPWRMAAAALHRLGRTDEIDDWFAPVVGELTARIVRRMLQQGVNCPRTTSAGRWFDAAAGALGLCVRQSTEAEAAMALELHAREYLQDHPDFDVPWVSMDPAPLVAKLFPLSTQSYTERARGAALFHLGLAAGLAHRAIEAARDHGSRTVVLGGGCFLNQVLSDCLTEALKIAGLTVLRPQSVECGDAGLALGQAWVAGCIVSAGRAGQPALRKV
jgi:hydrogenase maturation protein HypF